jgi:small subunit ribosomal protein S16
MLVIRLSRTGKSAQPSYRVIVSEKSKDPWGKYLEILGHYYPKKEAKLVDLKEERLKYWIGKGAQLSETVNNILINQGVINTKKVRMVKISKRRAAKAVVKAAESKKVSEAASKAEAAKTEIPAEAPKTETPAETKE